MRERVNYVLSYPNGPDLSESNPQCLLTIYVKRIIKERWYTSRMSTDICTNSMV